MDNMHLKKRWTEEDYNRLKIAYELGASYKIMEKIVKRSTSSINKYLDRSGIRQMGSKNYAPTSTTITLGRVLEAVRQYEEKNAPFVLPPLLIKDTPASPRLFKEVNKKNRDQTSVYKTSIFYVISYLSQKGLSVMRINDSHPLLNYKYKVNRVPMTEKQMIVHANRMRLDAKELPFLIEGFFEG